MKAKYLAGAMLMAILGAFIALFAYTRFIDAPSVSGIKSESLLETEAAKPLLTSMQLQAAPVDLTFAAEQTVHAVVHVRTTSLVSSQYGNPLWEFFYGENYRRQPREVQGFGSGVIISRDGYIITNNHVIEGAEEVNIKLNDNRESKAVVIGRDPSTDIAVVKIKDDNLPFVKYGNSDQLRLGDWVLAVGNPFNLTSTVTAGIISAKGRSLGILDDRYRIESFLQTDAALNMGNSGGALVNTKGELVGITTAIISPSGAYAGNSFAVPVNLVKKVVDDLIQYGEVQRAIMGVNIQDVTSELVEKEGLKLSEVKGVYVGSTVEGGSADDAGIKSKDVIVKFNGAAVNTTAELQEQVGKYRPGDKVQVTYNRNGKEATATVTLKNISNNTNIVKAGEGGGMVFGVKLEPVTQEDMKNYRIDYGVKVSEVSDGRFKDLGIKKGYIILTINGKKVNSAADVREFSSNEKTLNAIEGIQLNGTYFVFKSGR